MAFINKHLAEGLSYSNNWQADIEMSLRNEELDNLAIQKREEKVKYYAEIEKEGTAFDSYNNGKLEIDFAKLSNELAEYKMDHPNLETDVDLMREYRSKARKFQDNEIINESRKVQEQFQLFQDHYHSNNDQWSPEEHSAEMDRYLAYVNQDSETENPLSPYYFQAPPSMTFTDIIAVQSSITGMNQMHKSITNADGTKGTVTETYISEDNLDAAANRILSDTKQRNIAITSWESTFTKDGNPSDLFPDIQTFLKASVKATKDVGQSGYKDNAYDVARLKYGLENLSVINPYVKYVNERLSLSGYVNGTDFDLFTSAGEIGNYFESNADIRSMPGFKDDGKLDFSTSLGITQFRGKITNEGSTGIVRDPSNNDWVKVNISAELPKHLDITGFDTQEDYLKSIGLILDPIEEIDAKLDLDKVISLWDPKKPRTVSGTVLVPMNKTEGNISRYNLQYITKDDNSAINDYSAVTGANVANTATPGVNTVIGFLDSNYSGKWGSIEASQIPASIIELGGGAQYTYFTDSISGKYAVYRNGKIEILDKLDKDLT